MRLFVVEFERELKKEFSEKIAGENLAQLLADTGFEAEAGFQLKCEVEKINSSFHVRAHIVGDVDFECGKCLERSRITLDAEAAWVLMTQSSFATRYDDDEIELSEEDLDVSVYEGDEIDLLPLIREAVLLELPTHPICVTDVKKCEEAYHRNIGDKVVEELEESSMDLRWGPLRELKLKD